MATKGNFTLIPGHSILSVFFYYYWLMIIKFTFDYNSFNLENFSKTMLSLNLKSGIPYFIYISLPTGIRLSDIMPFSIQRYDRGDPFEYLTYSKEDSTNKCVKHLYKKITNALNSLEPSYPLIKKSISISVVSNFFK